jgi:hypothetical protein
MERPSRALCAVYALAALGALFATWSQNLAFFASPANDGALAFLRAAYANPAAASLSNDLFFLCFTAVVWMVVEARRHRIRFVWVYVVLSFAVAISVSFPLFLIAREGRLAQERGGRGAASPSM